VKLIFRAANEFDLKISIQIDEYKDRTVESVRQNLKYFIDHFNGSLIHFNVLSKKKSLPIFYIKDSYKIDPNEWKKLLSKSGQLTIRGTAYDAIAIGHVSSSDHKSFVRRSNFDGLYPYLPSNGATYASTWKNWVNLKKFSDLYKMAFVPAIGPGFYDKSKYKKVKNQNHSVTNIKRYRSNGQYYDVGWRTALKNNLQIIMINSYNNWVDGTQIEAAIPVNGFRDYLPGEPEKYIELTGQWVDEYLKYKTNALKTRSEDSLGCYDFTNNTIC
jgi:glycoprotein endo-alpha-1,2-mannosidase